MTQALIDDFEPIEIKTQEGERVPAASTPPLYRTSDTVEHEYAIR